MAKRQTKGVKKRKPIAAAVLKNLEKALAKLEEALNLPPTEINRDASIQRFEFSFELSWKAIQRFLRMKDILAGGPRDCFRQGARYGVVNNPGRWFDYLKARNLTTHVYDEDTAKEVYGNARRFPKDARRLLKKLMEEIQ